MSNKIRKIYLAGALFGAGERIHNLYLERELKKLGYEVLLPQRRAKAFVSDGELDLDAVREDCFACAANEEVMYVGTVDGPDVDGGTAMEYGVAYHAKKRAIIARTDFRTIVKSEIGLSAMLRMKGTELVYQPCYITELDEIDAFYEELAKKIHEAILSYE